MALERSYAHSYYGRLWVCRCSMWPPIFPGFGSFSPLSLLDALSLVTRPTSSKSITTYLVENSKCTQLPGLLTAAPVVNFYIATTSIVIILWRIISSLYRWLFRLREHTGIGPRLSLLLADLSRASILMAAVAISGTDILIVAYSM